MSTHGRPISTYQNAIARATRRTIAREKHHIIQRKKLNPIGVKRFSERNKALGLPEWPVPRDQKTRLMRRKSRKPVTLPKLIFKEE